MDTQEIQLNELADWLERFMKAENLSVEQMAKSMEVARQTIYNILDGGWPSRKVMEKLGLHLVFKRERSQ